MDYHTLVGIKLDKAYAFFIGVYFSHSLNDRQVFFQEYIRGMIFFEYADVSYIPISKSPAEKQSETILNVCSSTTQADPFRVGNSLLFNLFSFILFYGVRCILMPCL